MNIQLKYLGAVLFAAMVVGAGLTRWLAPRTVQVTKTDTVEHEVVKDHVVTLTKEIDRKDGSREITTEKVDDRTNLDTKKVESTTIAPVLAPRPNWFVTGGAGLDFSSVSNLANPVYMGSVNYRLVGPIYGGMWVDTQSLSKTRAGLQLGWEF